MSPDSDRRERKPAYEPPRLLSLRTPVALADCPSGSGASGVCQPSGSVNLGNCLSGAFAQPICTTGGNATTCTSVGSGDA